MQPPQGSQPHPVPTDQRKNGRSLPVKLEQPAGSGEKPALNQGSSGSPGKGTGSSIQQGGQKRRTSKPVVVDGDGMVTKAEVTSNRLRQGTGGASTSGESHSHVDLAAACPDQADAVGGSGGLVCSACICCPSFRAGLSPLDVGCSMLIGRRLPRILFQRHWVLKGCSWVPACCKLVFCCSQHLL